MLTDSCVTTDSSSSMHNNTKYVYIYQDPKYVLSKRVEDIESYSNKLSIYTYKKCEETMWKNHTLQTDCLLCTLSPLKNKTIVNQVSYYAAGDNVDVIVNPSYMTALNQRKDYYWFLSLAIKKRIVNYALSDKKPTCNIKSCHFTHGCQQNQKCQNTPFT